MKLLIASLDNIGDCIMAAGLAQSIKASNPGTDVCIWVKKYAEGILPFSGLDGIACDPFWDKNPGGPKGRFSEFAATLSVIRRRRFDAAIVLHTNWKKSLACRLAGIGKIYGFSGKAGTALLSGSVPPPSGHEHLLDAYRRLANSCGFETGDIKCRLSRKAGFPKKAARTIVMHPLSGGADRNWPVTKYMELGEMILSAGDDRFLWIWASPNEKQKLLADAERLAGKFKSRVSFTCDAAPALEDTISLLATADCFIGNDSGPLHCTSALGIPSAGIFLPGKKRQFAPRGTLPPVIIENRIPAEISAVTVYETVSRLLSPGPGPL